MTEQGLYLHPDLPSLTREQIEAHLELVRSKRMLAAMTYQEGVKSKNARASIQIKRQLAQQYTLLGKDILRVDKNIEALDKRMARIAALENNGALVADMDEVE